MSALVQINVDSAPLRMRIVGWDEAQIPTRLAIHSTKYGIQISDRTQVSECLELFGQNLKKKVEYIT